MSKTWKTKPAKMQINDAMRKHGKVNWKTDVTFRKHYCCDFCSSGNGWKYEKKSKAIDIDKNLG